MQIFSLFKIDQGKVREVQQDALLCLDLWDTERQSKVFVLADGMGGMKKGEVASALACEMAEKAYSVRNEAFLGGKKIVSKCLRKANKMIKRENDKVSFDEHMGTTMTCVEFFRDKLQYSHIGDSRLYRYRKNLLSQLSKDHAHADGTLTQAIGLEKKLKVDSRELKLKEKDIYLLCSDGLYGLIEHGRMLEIFKTHESLEGLAETLLEQALVNGGFDNISFILIQLK